MSDGPRLRGVNMTNFFKRELFMYALGDIKFKKPVSLKKMAYVTGFLLCWTLPLFMVFGLKFNPFYMIILFAPPVIAGHYATKPVFGGKNLVDFVRTMIAFFQEPKGWTDLTKNNQMGEVTYFVENEIWIGRRREILLLEKLKEEEKLSKKSSKKQRLDK